MNKINLFFIAFAMGPSGICAAAQGQKFYQWEPEALCKVGQSHYQDDVERYDRPGMKPYWIERSEPSGYKIESKNNETIELPQQGIYRVIRMPRAIWNERQKKYEIARSFRKSGVLIGTFLSGLGLFPVLYNLALYGQDRQKSLPGILYGQDRQKSLPGIDVLRGIAAICSGIMIGISGFMYEQAKRLPIEGRASIFPRDNNVPRLTDKKDEKYAHIVLTQLREKCASPLLQEGYIKEASSENGQPVLQEGRYSELAQS